MVRYLAYRRLRMAIRHASATDMRLKTRRWQSAAIR